MNPIYQIISRMDTEQEFEQFLDILFTEKERAMLNERWQIFEALHEGRSQREVAKHVHCSVVTVTRGAKAYREHKSTITKYIETTKTPTPTATP